MKTLDHKFALGLLLLSGMALAHGNIERCAGSPDTLGPESAAGRRAWAMKCDPRNRGLYIANEYWNFSDGSRRRAYPTFGKVGDDGSITDPLGYIAPTDPKAECNLPEGYSLIHFCSAGCYSPEQQILLPHGYMPIAEARTLKASWVMALSSDSSLEQPRMSPVAVQNFSADMKAFEQEMLTIDMVSGGQLRVTTNHPLVDGQGRMREAQSLRVGDRLMRVSGTPDRIRSIRSAREVTRVYNVNVDHPGMLENIVAAQGYLNGSIFYQNEGVRYFNQRVLRSVILPASVLE